MIPWANVEDDLEFAEPGKYSSQVGQANVFEGREDWSLLLELNLRNDHNNETWKGIVWAKYLCSRTHAHRLVGT